MNYHQIISKLTDFKAELFKLDLNDKDAQNIDRHIIGLEKLLKRIYKQYLNNNQ